MNLLIISSWFFNWPGSVPFQAGLVLFGILLMTVRQILAWL